MSSYRIFLCFRSFLFLSYGFLFRSGIPINPFWGDRLPRTSWGAQVRQNQTGCPVASAGCPAASAGCPLSELWWQGGVLSYYVVLCVSGCRKGDPKTKVLGKSLLYKCFSKSIVVYLKSPRRRRENSSTVNCCVKITSQIAM